MDNKQELKKQLIVLTIILILVISIASLVNRKDVRNNNLETNKNQEIVTEEEKILDNLKGLLEGNDDTEEYTQEEIEGKEEKKIITNSGETVIVRE